MTTQKITRDFFKKAILIVRENKIESGPVINHLSFLAAWEKRNNGDPIFHFSPAAGSDAKKQVAEFKRCWDLTSPSYS